MGVMDVICGARAFHPFQLLLFNSQIALNLGGFISQGFGESEFL